MAASRKVELGTLYLAGPGGIACAVRPANGKKFTYDEQRLAVGGFIEMMIPAVKNRQVYVNEEGALKGLPLNSHTWDFACRYVYCVLNGYAPTWQVSGNALEVYKVEAEQFIKELPTVLQALPHVILNQEVPV